MTRDIIKGIKLLLAAVFAAAVFFPFVHEGGHAFFTLLTRGEIKEFVLFPVPSVLCGVSGLSPFQIVFIGSGGTVLTFLVSVLLSFRKPFLLWFFSFCFRGMTAVSLGMSLVSLLLLPFGICLESEDVVTMLTYWNWGFFPMLFSLVLLLSCMIIMLKRDRFFKRLLQFFGMESLRLRKEKRKNQPEPEPNPEPNPKSAL